MAISLKTTKVVSLKISNVLENLPELMMRVRVIKSPGKKVLVNAITSENKQEVIKELLYRLELYTKLRVLNYTRQDLSIIVGTIHKFGFNVVLESMIKSYVVSKPIDKKVEVAKIIEDLSNMCYSEIEKAIENGLISTPEEALNDEYDNNGTFFDTLNVADLIYDRLGDIGLEPGDELIAGIEIGESTYDAIFNKVNELCESEDDEDKNTIDVNSFGLQAIFTTYNIQRLEAHISFDDFKRLAFEVYNTCISVCGDYNLPLDEYGKYDPTKLDNDIKYGIVDDIRDDNTLIVDEKVFKVLLNMIPKMYLYS